RSRGHGRPGPRSRRRTPRQGADRSPALRSEPERRRRRHRIGLPHPRRARGLRSAAGPAGADEGPARHVRPRRSRCSGHGRRGRARVPREPPLSTSEYDSYRPPEPEGGRRKRRRGGGPGAGGGRRGGRRGGGWKHRGAEGNRERPMVEDVECASCYGRPIVQAPPWGDGLGADLCRGGLAGGSSLLSLGTWILSGFGAGSGVLAAIEVDRLTGERVLPMGPLRRVLHALETPAAIESAVFATPLAAYTGALLGDTAVPTWNAAGRNGLS